MPCRLIKGSHYTGVEDGAVNIIKLEDERLWFLSTFDFQIHSFLLISIYIIECTFC